MIWILLPLMLAAQDTDGPPPPDTNRVEFHGSLVVVNDPPYGHPGTPLSVVRINADNGAIASVVRLSSRPTPGSDAQPGLGGCITFQMKLLDGGPDTDLAHLCVVLDESGSAQADLWLRDALGQYSVVQSWLPGSGAVFAKGDIR